MSDTTVVGVATVDASIEEMRMARIRWRTGVPARVGGRVRYWGRSQPREATIKGTRGGYLQVLFDGATELTAIPATWHLQYLDEAGRVIWADKGLEAQA